MTAYFEDLEGRTYVDHIQAQHRQIHQLLERLRSAIFGAEACEVAFQEGKLLLCDLETQLTHHFAEERGGGCLEEAVSRCPRLSTAARELQRRYPELLASLDRVAIAFDRGPVLGKSRPAVEAALDQFGQLFAEMEAEEHRILREAFACEDGFSAQDAEQR